MQAVPDTQLVLEPKRKPRPGYFKKICQVSEYHLITVSGDMKTADLDVAIPPSCSLDKTLSAATVYKIYLWRERDL